MSREIKQLHKNYHDMSQNEIWDTIRKIRTKANLQANTKQARDLAQILYELFDLPVMTEKISNQLILLNQLIELVEWTKKDKKILNLLVQSIQKIPIVNHSITKEERLNIFKKLSQMMKKFPENTSLLDAASQVIVEIIRRSQDQEILSIISQMKEITMNNPLNEAIQLLHARVYMNAFFYLTIQDITIIDRLYEEFSCFALSKSTDENLPQCQIKKLYIVENINEIFQEGIINAIINLARIRKQRENDCDECLNLIRKILTDSEQFLRKEEEDQSFFKDVYRLLYAFEQFNLWDHFQDIPLINELKQLQEKSMENKKAQTKLLAIRKLMRIDEYDALKIGRRGLLLKYDFGNPDNIKVLINDIRNHLEKEKDFFLVEKVDAIISQDSKIEKSLREKGYIPQDKKTISEIQDRTTKDDDLTQSAVQEIKLVEPLNFLRNINRNMEKNLPNQIAYAKGHIFAVGMFGYNSKTLQIKKEETKEIIITIENTMMMLEIIEPLTRAITLRAGRLDANATEFLLPFLTQHGLKFLSKIYSNYPFVSNLTRLLSYLGRTSQIDSLNQIKNELETANRLCLNDNTIPYKIARALNEAVLAFKGKNAQIEINLCKLVKEIAQLNSYEENIQIKYIDCQLFLLIDFINNFDRKIPSILEEILAFSKTYENNLSITKKTALGILLALSLKKERLKNKDINKLRKKIREIMERFPENSYLNTIQEIINKTE